VVEFGRVDHVPAPGEIVHASESWEVPGGGGAVAAVQLCKLAPEATLYTALGDDEVGHRCQTELERLGLRVQAVFRPWPQRRGFVHVDRAGERTITVIGDRLAPRGDLRARRRAVHRRGGQAGSTLRGILCHRARSLRGAAALADLA
jgi:ribokinase